MTYHDFALGKDITTTRAEAIDACQIRDADGVWHDADYHRGGPYVEPPPPSARATAKLGDRLAAAECALANAWAADSDPTRWTLWPNSMPSEDFYLLCDLHFVAEGNYQCAVSARTSAARDKLRNRKKILRSAKDAVALRGVMYSAEARVNEIEEIGREFYTDREVIDLRAAAWLARDAYEIAQTKFQDAQRQALADNRAGIIRVHHRRQPTVRHL